MKYKDVLDALNEISRLADLIQRWVPTEGKDDTNTRVHRTAMKIDAIACKTILGIRHE